MPSPSEDAGSAPEFEADNAAILIPFLSRRQEVAAIIVVAVAIRLVGITAPYTSQHWIKQLQIAPIAKNFATKDFNILWPETDYSADEPGYIEIEFQLVTWLTALLYRVFGIHEWVGRIVPIMASIGTMILLYRLILLFLEPASAVYGLIFYAFAPSTWYFSRVLMSEGLMLFFSVALVYSFSLYLRIGRWQQFACTAVCGAFCFLVKLPAMLLLIPLYYLAHRKYGFNALKRVDIWALLVVTIAPAIAYYIHSYSAIGQHYFTVGVGFQGGMWFSLQHFLDPGNYSLMATRFVHQHFTAVGMVLVPVGLLVTAGSRKSDALFHIWFAAVVLYMVVVSGGNLRQNYYQLHVMLPAAAFFGLGMRAIARSDYVHHHTPAVLTALFLALCIWGVEPMFQLYKPIHRAARELNQLDPTDKPVIILPAGYGCLYYFDRPGWVGREAMGKAHETVPPEDIVSPLYITDRIGRGARWAVYFDTDDHTEQPQIQQYLRETFLYVRDRQQYQIFDLHKRPDGTKYSVEGEPKAGG